MVRNICYFLFFLFLNDTGQAQNYRWAKSFGGENQEDFPVCDILNDGTTFVAWSSRKYGEIDSFKSKNFGNSSIPLIAKLDSKGKALWVWEPDTFSGSIIFYDIVVSKSGSIYACGNFNGTIGSGSRQWQSALLKSSAGFVLQLDHRGFLNSFSFLADSNSNSSFDRMVFTSDNSVLVSCFINIPRGKPPLMISSIGLRVTKVSSVVLGFDSSLNLVRHSDVIEGFAFRLNLHVLDSASVLITSSTSGIWGPLRINGNTIRDSGDWIAGYVFLLNDSLRITMSKVLCTSLSEITIFSSTRLVDGTLIIGGKIKDSVVFNNAKTYYKTGSNTSTVLWAAFDTNYNFLWSKFPTSESNTGGSHYIWSLDNNGDFFYGGGQIYGSYTYDEFQLPDNLGTMWYFKGDKKGNILWMRRTNPTAGIGSRINDISVNKQGTMVFVGPFTGTAIIDGKTYNSKGSDDVLAFCIKDIEIFRGPVSPGPYCAGDTLEIPYTKDGTFDTSNYFIAQLSDENGYFSGGERELGRVKRNTDGTIKGVLPLFDVASSPAYRIRILSTNPVVQSYYKYDTLRLLIYSKDTAYSGRDTLICGGQRVPLTTTGGSRWHWSPGQFVADSTAKSTFAIPEVTTNFRIIISDSSGCGDIDTAYKLIAVREPLEIWNKDTLVCKGIASLFTMTASGGESSGYQYQWLDTGWSLLSSQNTLNYTPTSHSILHLVLSDNCTMLNDTHSIQVFVPKKIVFETPTDSLVCKGTAVEIGINSSGGLGEHFVHWLVPNDTFTKGNERLPVTISTDISFRFEVQDFCGAKSDKGNFNYSIYPAVEINQKPDTTACLGSQVLISPMAESGKPPYSYIWLVRDTLKDVVYFDKDLNLKISQPTVVFLRVADRCGSEKFDTFNINVLPPIFLSYSGDSIVCPDGLAHVKATVSGGKNPIIWLYKKGTNQPITSRLSILDTFLRINVPTIFKLTASDNCTVLNDSLEFKIELFEKVNSGFKWTPQNPTVYDTLILIPTDTTQFLYIWFKDQQKDAELPAPGIHRMRRTTEGATDISLIVSSKEACVDSSEYAIHFVDGEFIYIPNSFSPNEDGQNDVFKPIGKSVFKFQINIFDRLHTQIFEGEENEPWKGIRVRSAIDRYLYIISVNTEFGKTYTFKGMVTLVR